MKIGNDLTEDETDQLKALLRDNSDNFYFPGNKGLTQTIEHKIKLTAPGQINCPPERQNSALIDEINKAVEQHYKKGHDVVPSTSPWAFGFVPLKKPDRSIRLLKKITETDSFPTGNMNEALDQLLGAQYFNVPTLQSSYPHVIERP